MKPAVNDLYKQNTLLAIPSPADLDLLLPALRPFAAKPNAVLYIPGQHVQTVYFPCGPAVASFMVSVNGSEEERAVETMLVGREGAVGGIVSQGRLPAYSRMTVQSGGQFLTLPVPSLDQAKLASRNLENLFARYADCVMAQVFQATACNATHPIEKRAAKWILAAAERSGTDEVQLTQDRLSAMLGVGRSYVSRIIQALKADGTLTVRRGRIFIHDVERLRQRSCSCNDRVRDHFDLVLNGVYPEPDSGSQLRFERQ